MRELERYIPQKDYLICVDSDGCAMDTMDIKHKRCFGPCMVAEWNLEPWERPVLELWNTINLYSMDRGINRFKGLALALEEIDKKYTPIDGIEQLKRWVDGARELSEPALEAEIAKSQSPILKKALHWSREVSSNISKISWSEKRPFPGVKEGFSAVKDFADIVIVSSANRDAVEEEWRRFGLFPLVDLILCQDSGSKAHCIGELKKRGYKDSHILMVGDAPGDKEAADMNHVFYYPILVNREAESWRDFPQAARLLRAGEYRPFGERKEREFLANLTHTA